MFISKVIHTARSVASGIELRLLEKRASVHGFELTKKKQLSDSEIVVSNFFGTTFQKNALLSYVIYPFLSKMHNHHSNYRECYTIAAILNELEYNVDIIQYDNTTFLPKKNYDIIIDNHNNLERLSKYISGTVKRIFHATNAHILYQNWIEYGRYYELFQEKGVCITPPRVRTPCNSAAHCDAISMFGNDFTRATYGIYKDKVYQVPVSVTTEPEIIERDYSAAKKKFLWLNSHGALLKGLDVVIDAFSMMPEFELYVCGDFERDNVFMKTISVQLSKAPNIKLEGWVDTDGEYFRKIVSKCAWIAGTSFSEGGGGSILNGMAKGLIPVISRASSITLPENAGFYLDNNDAASLAALVGRITTLNNTHMKEMSDNVYGFVASNHTIENFKNKYKEFLLIVSV